MLPKFLRESYPPEKHAHLVSKFCCHVVGTYPRSEKKIWRTMWTSFNWLLLGYGCYAELTFGIHYINIDIVKAMDAFCPVATSLISWVKMTVVWWYRNELVDLMNHMRRLTAEMKSPEKMKIKRRYYTAATRLAFVTAYLGYATTVAYSLRPLMKNMMQLMRGEEVTHDTPFHMIFPDILNSKHIYPITLILTHWHGFVTVTGFCTADMLFTEFCFYFGALFKALQVDIRELLSFNEKPSSSVEADTCLKLANLIKRHNEIIDMVAQFSNIMVAVTLGHFISSSIVIGTSVVDMLLFSGYGILLYMVYTSAVSMELFLYSLGGQIVIETSQEVARVVYDSYWYSYGVKVQKMVLLILIRAQRSVVVKVPFFAPSLPALTSILRFTGSLVALAKSIL